MSGRYVPDMGFTAEADCDNCDGTGLFEGADLPPGHADRTPCHFCQSAAIVRGELDGIADGVPYVGGVRQTT